MKVNDAYKLCKENSCDETYEQFGKALLQFVHAETNRLFRTRATRVEREDIGGESLIKVLSKLDKFRGESTFATWTSQIILHEGERALSNLGKLCQQGLIGNESCDPGPSLIDKITLKQLVAKLDKEDQQLVQLKLEGLEDEEIAKELGISYDAAKKRRERIQEKLRTLYGGGKNE